MRHAFLLLVLVALAAPVAATGELATGTKTPRSVLAIQSSKRGDFLVRLDGSSLRRLSRPLKLGGWASYRGWSFSPDGRRLALGVDRAYGFRIFDVRRLKRVAKVRTWSMNVSFLAWLAPRRIIGYEPAGFFAADPVTRKQLPAPQLTDAVPTTLTRAGDVVVVVLAPTTDIGDVGLAVIDAQTRVRRVQLEGIKAGTRYDWETMRAESHVPGLAVDPDGRAFLLGGRDEPVAEVDLKTLAVTYHRPQHSRSFLSRFHDWLEPLAAAKGPLTGSFRRAAWVGDSRIAVWGYDRAPVGPEGVETSPAGLSLVNTRDWTIETLDANALHAAFTADTLLSAAAGSGLTAWSAAGQRRYRLFEGESAWVAATFGSRAFVATRNAPLYIVDAESGRVVGSRQVIPRLLHPDFLWW